MRYRGQRWVRIGLRTAHLIAVMLVAADALAGSPVDDGALAALVVSGAGLVGDDALRYGVSVVRYLSFWAVIAKVALLLVGVAHPAWLPGTLIAAVVVGGIISHAPGTVRHWAVTGPPGPCATKERTCRPTPS